MEYWTVMIIAVLGGYLDGAQVVIPYSTKATCEAALNAVSDTLDYDHSITCEETAQPSGSIRPQSRSNSDE